MSSYGKSEACTNTHVPAEAREEQGESEVETDRERETDREPTSTAAKQ